MDELHTRPGRNVIDEELHGADGTAEAVDDVRIQNQPLSGDWMIGRPPWRDADSRSSHPLPEGYGVARQELVIAAVTAVDPVASTDEVMDRQVRAAALVDRRRRSSLVAIDPKLERPRRNVGRMSVREHGRPEGDAVSVLRRIP